MPSKHGLEILWGNIMFFYFKEFDVIVHEKYFPCITIKFLGNLCHKSLSIMVVEVGTRHSHQMLLISGNNCWLTAACGSFDEALQNNWSDQPRSLIIELGLLEDGRLWRNHDPRDDSYISSYSQNCCVAARASVAGAESEDRGCGDKQINVKGRTVKLLRSHLELIKHNY